MSHEKWIELPGRRSYTLARVVLAWEACRLAIPMNTAVKVLLMSGEQVDGEVAMADQTTYLCLRRENETLYLPWSAIKCVRGPALPERTVSGGFSSKLPGGG